MRKARNTTINILSKQRELLKIINVISPRAAFFSHPVHAYMRDIVSLYAPCLIKPVITIWINENTGF